jgi:hypothetical protein
VEDKEEHEEAERPVKDKVFDMSKGDGGGNDDDDGSQEEDMEPTPPSEGDKVISLKVEIISERRSITVSAAGDDTVGYIKVQIQFQTKTPARHQRLEFHNIQLMSNDETLMDCNMEQDSVLKMCGRLSGGAKKVSKVAITKHLKMQDIKTHIKVHNTSALHRDEAVRKLNQKMNDFSKFVEDAKSEEDGVAQWVIQRCTLENALALKEIMGTRCTSSEVRIGKMAACMLSPEYQEVEKIQQEAKELLENAEAAACYGFVKKHWNDSSSSYDMELFKGELHKVLMELEIKRRVLAMTSTMADSSMGDKSME